MKRTARQMVQCQISVQKFRENKELVGVCYLWAANQMKRVPHR